MGTVNKKSSAYYSICQHSKIKVQNGPKIGLRNPRENANDRWRGTRRGGFKGGGSPPPLHFENFCKNGKKSTHFKTKRTYFHYILLFLIFTLFFIFFILSLFFRISLFFSNFHCSTQFHYFSVFFWISLFCKISFIIIFSWMKIRHL